MSIKKIFKSILAKYLIFANIFLKELAIEILKCLYINKQTINQKVSQQVFYKPIYSFELIKLENLKTFILINLDKSFI